MQCLCICTAYTRGFLSAPRQVYVPAIVKPATGTITALCLHVCGCVGGWVVGLVGGGETGCCALRERRLRAYRYKDVPLADAAAFLFHLRAGPLVTCRGGFLRFCRRAGKGLPGCAFSLSCRSDGPLFDRTVPDIYLVFGLRREWW